MLELGWKVKGGFMNDRCEIVYVLRNEAFPELIKIGKTRRQDIQERMNELYSTGVPFPFECLWAGEVDDCSEVEYLLHNAFLGCRVNPKREFFKLEPERVIPLLKKLSLNEITPQLNDAINKEVTIDEKNAVGTYKKEYRKRRPNLNFEEMGIPLNSELVFESDNNIKAIVVANQRVQYNGEVNSLSGLTKELLQVPYYVGPCRYWTYNGKNLNDIYDEAYPYVEE